MLKEKLEKMLNEMGGGAGIEVTAEAEDLKMIPEPYVTLEKGKMRFFGIDKDNSIPLTVYKFSAKGYMDGMSDVKGEVISLRGYLGQNFKTDLQAQIQNALKTMNEDIFKPATGKEVERRRATIPATVNFEIDSYSGELRDVVGGGYMRGGPTGFTFNWEQVGVKAYISTGDYEAELEGFTMDVSGQLNGKLGVKWYKDIFQPSGYDPEDYDKDEEGNPEMPEDMYWDMYWEDMEQEWGAR